MARIEINKYTKATSHERTFLIPDSGQDLCSQVTNSAKLPLFTGQFMHLRRKLTSKFGCTMVEPKIKGFSQTYSTALTTAMVYGSYTL